MSHANMLNNTTLQRLFK